MVVILSSSRTGRRTPAPPSRGGSGRTRGIATIAERCTLTETLAVGTDQGLGRLERTVEELILNVRGIFGRIREALFDPRRIA